MITTIPAAPRSSLEPMTPEQRKQFLAERRSSIGSSDIAALFGLDPWRTSWHVYLEKTGDLPDNAGEDTPALQWGRYLEDVVAYAYETERGVTPVVPEVRTFRHRSVPHLSASPDRFVELAGNRCVLEIKTAGQRHYESGDWGVPGTDEIPDHYLLQVQHQLGVLDLQLAHVAVLFGGNDFQVYVVERNEQLVHKIFRKADDFWEKNVRPRTPPPPDWQHASTGDLVKSLYTEVHGGTVLNLPASLDAECAEYRRLLDEADRIDAEKQAIKARLLEAMGNGELGITPRGYRLSRKAVERRSYTVEATSYVMFNVREPKTGGGS